MIRLLSRPLPSPSQVSKWVSLVFNLPVCCVSPVNLSDGRTGRGAKSFRESLALYKSFNTLWMKLMSQCQQQHLLSLLQPKEILAESVAPPPPPTVPNHPEQEMSNLSHYLFRSRHQFYVQLYIIPNIFLSFINWGWILGGTKVMRVFLQLLFTVTSTNGF